MGTFLFFINNLPICTSLRSKPELFSIAIPSDMEKILLCLESKNLFSDLLWLFKLEEVSKYSYAISLIE